MAEARFKRVLLKLSGEALLGSREYGTDADRVERIAMQIHEVSARGVEMALVVGAGNIYRGLAAAALRALEIHAEAILMAKHGVEGVYDADPSEVPDAKFLPEITHRQAIERGLRVMDSTALTLCMDNALPIYVFNLADVRNIDRIVSGERVGTLVSSDGALTRVASDEE